MEELEAGSSAEVVVAVARQSGRYGDLELIYPIGSCWLMMGFLLLSPFEFPDWSLLPAVMLAFLVGFLLSRAPVLRGRLPKARVRRQVEDAARATFMREHVGGTRDRTGILVYLSLRESEVELLADYGVQAVVPDGEWNTVLDRVRKAPPNQRLDTLVEGLRPMAQLLAERLPAAEDDRDELSNAPRMLTSPAEVLS